jgi:hypothetical protein
MPGLEIALPKHDGHRDEKASHEQGTEPKEVGAHRYGLLLIKSLSRKI